MRWTPEADDRTCDQDGNFMSAFRHRGVVEGYYGPAFSHDERLRLVEEIGRWGMNRYLYN